MKEDYGYMEFRFDQGRLDLSKEITIVSVDIEGQPLPESHYMAFGSKVHHYCFTKPHLECDCNDFVWGGEVRLCKHLIAALVKEEDVLMAILTDDV